MRPRRFDLSAFGIAALMLAIAAVTSACGASTPASPPAATNPPAAASTTTATKTWKVALVLPGPANDKGFNQTAYEALQEIKTRFGAQIAFTESTPVPQYVQTYRNYASQGFDIVVGQGFEFGDPASQVAPEFPNTKFLVSGNPDVSGPNLQGLVAVVQNPSYLAGEVAGMVTKSGKVAGIAGSDFPSIIAQMEGFRLGVQAAKPDAKVTISYLGSFDDVQKGKEATTAAISGGADVVFHIADAAGVAVIQAAKENNVYAIGFGADQNSLAPQTVITSSVINYGTIIIEGVQDVIEGKFTGKTREFDVDDPAVTLAPIRVVSPDLATKIQAKLDADKKAMIGGTLKVDYITKSQS